MTQDTKATAPADTNSSTNESHGVATSTPSQGPQSPSQARVIADIAIIVIFVAAIGLPLLDMVLGIDTTPSSENRELAPVPGAIKALTQSDKGWSDRISGAKKHLGALPREVKLYTGDHFGFRNFLIRQHGEFKFNLLGVSSTHHVLLGKHDQSTADDPAGQWLYFNRYRVIDHYRATDLFNDEELEQWRLVLEQRQQWLAAKGIRYLVLIAPNKHSIYPEYLPDEINRVGERTRTDQLMAYLSEHSNIEVIDSRPLLLKARKEQPDLRLFHRTDTHWNEVGAFLAYEAMAGRLADWFPAIKPMNWNDLTLRRSIEPAGDLSRLMGIQNRFKEHHLNLDPNPPRVARVQRDQFEENRVESTLENPELPKLLLFRDSFGAALMPLLAQHFESATFIWTDQFNPRAVEETKPNVVISEMLERLLMRKPPPLVVELEVKPRH